MESSDEGMGAGAVMDPAAFAEARLAEDEAEADTGVCGCYDANHAPSCVPTPWKDRALREVAFKRAILAIHGPMPSMYGEPPVCSACWPAPQIATHPLWPCSTVRQMITVWSDHPDYDLEWRP